MSTIDICSMIIELIGGLALFLFGMSLLSSSLEKLSTGKIEKILEKLTGNIFTSILFGILVTALIQSSSATTVIVIGLVNAGILKFKSGAGLVMGATIGTTITGQILRLNDLSSSSNSVLALLTPQILASIIAIIGIILFMILKKDKFKNMGNACFGLAILFTGMISMKSAVAPLQEVDTFSNLFSTFSNPLIGILIGAVVTGILQSSSASIGILQALSSTGAITYSAAIPIIIGQNIGTCITPLISSVNTNKNAKRIAIFHLYFKILGAVLLLIGIYSLQHFIGFDFWDKTISIGGIADFHTLLSIIMTVAFIPLFKLLERLTFATVKPTDINALPPSELALLDERLIAVPALAIGQINKIAVKMGEYTKENFIDAKSLFYKFDDYTVYKINEREDTIDNIDDVLNNYITRFRDKFNNNNNEIKNVTTVIHISSSFERISDHCVNLLEAAQKLHESSMNFSDSTMKDFSSMLGAVEEICTMAVSAFINNDPELAKQIEPLEEVIDLLEYNIKSGYITKLNNKKDSIDVGVIFLEILSNLERIADHCANIAIFVIGKNDNSLALNPHEYINKIHNEQTAKYMEISDMYIKKYLTI